MLRNSGAPANGPYEWQRQGAAAQVAQEIPGRPQRALARPHDVAPEGSSRVLQGS